jgi:branched-chain amino acid aminotransferase
MAQSQFAAGAAYVDGRVMPLAEASVPLTDYGYRRSDVTYDVVSVWNRACNGMSGGRQASNIRL